MQPGTCQNDPRRPSGFSACLCCALSEHLGGSYQSGGVNGYDHVILHDHDEDVDRCLMEGDVRAALNLCPRMQGAIGHLAEVKTIPEGFAVITPISLSEIELIRLQIESILQQSLMPVNSVTVTVWEVQNTVFLLEIKLLAGLEAYLYEDKILAVLQENPEFKDIFYTMVFQMRESVNGFMVTASLPRQT